MNTRREFLGTTAGALAGIAFVGCDLLAAAPARAQARRREVMVGGRRVKTVDVHAHCAVPEAMALMGLKLSTPGSTLPPLLHERRIGGNVWPAPRGPRRVHRQRQGQRQQRDVHIKRRQRLALTCRNVEQSASAAEVL